MNKANLRAYAPKARLDFIAAVTARSNLLGISGKDAYPADARGDVVIIDGREWPAKVSAQRDRLISRIKIRGFEQTMDEVAYTWFNRFAALRFMEIHEYLDHGWRVLSSREGGLPEILRHASEVSLHGLNADRARQMQLAGNQDNELYKLLVVAQCNELSRTMPFLFERIDDETELLLPENLLRTDSIVAKLVAAVPEEDWQQIEVIGWLYQFYISERKDEVIGKIVKTEDIPAATQLFTPNWIVRYMVQNTLGRLWLIANPNSALATEWPFYVSPAKQTADVQGQLDALRQARLDTDAGKLNPETITFLDPACGSGHILVVAYELLKSIYLERGYQLRVIPRLILEKNLYGLDIDDRAAQLAAFALLMQARADDRRLFEGPIKLNVLAIQESNELNCDEFADNLAAHGIKRNQVQSLFKAFEHAKTFGSLIRLPEALRQDLAAINEGALQGLRDGDLYAAAAARSVLPLVRQALVMQMEFDVVVANPPYMGSRYYANGLKLYIDTEYETAKGDLYTCFVMRNAIFALKGGRVGMITIPNWMFLSTFESFREWFFQTTAIETFSDNGRGVFGSDFGSSAFTFINAPIAKLLGKYFRLFETQGSVQSIDELRSKFLCSQPFMASVADFNKIPGTPVAYWVSEKSRSIFSGGPSLGTCVNARQGLATADNARFLRLWHEVDFRRIGFGMSSRAEAQSSGLTWFPYNKGGDFRKWYGNLEYVVNWRNDGADIRCFGTEDGGRPRSRAQNTEFYFQPAVTWSDITIAENAFRFVPRGCIHDSTGHSAFGLGARRNLLLSFCNNKFASEMIKVLNPGVHFHIGYFNKLPYPTKIETTDLSHIDRLVEVAREDWDESETSWDFKSLFSGLLQAGKSTISATWGDWQQVASSRIAECRELEERNNTIFAIAYELGDEFPSEVREDQVTLRRADRSLDCKRLISYAIGCVMGRYSLNEPGLVYAHAANIGFDSSRYTTFPADADGIVPLTDERWFEDGADVRVREFLRIVWGVQTLEENMEWLADGLGVKGSETPDETIRRYLTDRFFQDHVQTYRKRPIYWLFSSGRHGGFQALVYLHRYNEGTLARLRAEYVVPLVAKVNARLEMLDRDAAAASSGAARTKIRKQIEVLRRKQVELLAYDERLRHYADMRIALDLDVGVKSNYSKFGDLVAESKAITGGSDD